MKPTPATGQQPAGPGLRRPLARLVWLGPAFVAAVAYIDPGNFATNIEGGARFGYALLWVVVASNLMAMLIQILAAKLGLATGMNLAEVCRERLPRPLVWAMWGIMELVAIATDLAEFLGAALGFHLLLGMPLFSAAILTAFVTFGLLAFQGEGARKFEVIIAGFVALIGIAYLLEFFFADPSWAGILSGLKPGFPEENRDDAVFLATGILGATVMPHVIFLHSALTQHRMFGLDAAGRKTIHRLQIVDVVGAMTLAGLINAAMLVVSAAAFHARGHQDVGSIEVAYVTLEGVLGPFAKQIFGVALLASGLSSSAVGTLSGQIIMQGFLRKKLPLWLRRTVTVLPALAIIGAGIDPTKALVWSQVILSLGLPFAVVPLIAFTAKRDLMGDLANRPRVTLLAALCGALIIILNVTLLLKIFA